MAAQGNVPKNSCPKSRGANSPIISCITIPRCPYKIFGKNTTPFPGSKTSPDSMRGPKVSQDTRLSMRECGNFGRRVTCTIAFEWWQHHSSSSICLCTGRKVNAGFGIPFLMQIWPAIRQTGNGSPDQGRMPFRTFEFSTPSCKAGNSTQMAGTSGDGFQSCKAASRKISISHGNHRTSLLFAIRLQSSNTPTQGPAHCGRTSQFHHDIGCLSCL